MWVSLAAVAILLATASSNVRQKGCRRGSIMKRDCNTCVCDATGSWACTGIVCPRGKRDISCSSEEMEDPIMKCACVEKGYGSAEDKAQCLTEEAAGKLQVERENRSTAVERICEPGTTFMEDCNTCQCNAQGNNAVCTLKECHQGLQSERVKRSSDGRWVCEPGLTFMKDCNQCQCNKDGTDMACTMRKCYAVCRPGQVAYKNCNFCICNGRTWKCTNRRCSPQHPLTLCPNHKYDIEGFRFKRDVKAQTGTQPAVCLKRMLGLKNCNTCRPVLTTPAPAGPTTESPQPPVCLPPYDKLKNCNTCTNRAKRRRFGTGVQQHISSPNQSSDNLFPHFVHSTHTKSPDWTEHNQIHIPPYKPPPKTTTESSDLYR